MRVTVYYDEKGGGVIRSGCEIVSLSKGEFLGVGYGPYGWDCPAGSIDQEARERKS